MKLLFCRNCHDMFKLASFTKYCNCRQSSGKYLEDGDNIEIQGSCEVVGITNISLVRGLKKLDAENNALGPDLTAFFFNRNYHKISRINSATFVNYLEVGDLNSLIINEFGLPNFDFVAEEELSGADFWVRNIIPELKTDFELKWLKNNDGYRTVGFLNHLCAIGKIDNGFYLVKI